MSENKEKDLRNGQKKQEEFEKFDTPMQATAKNFFRNKLAITGLVAFISIFLFVFIGSSLSEHKPYFDQPVLRDISPGFGYLDYPNEIENKNIVKIASGITFSVALDDEGDIYYWGVNNNNVLTPPQRILDILESENIVDIAAGDRHILILTEDNEIHGWGYNTFGQAGVERMIAEAEDTSGGYISCPPIGGCPPEMFEDNPALLLEQGIKSIGAADLMSYFITDDGYIKVWGATTNNRLDRVPDGIDGFAVDLDISPTAAITLLEDGTIRVFGAAGNVHNRYMPEEFREGTNKVSKIAITFRNAFVVDEDGTLHGWGASNAPVMRIPDFGQKVVDIAGGREHMTALLEDGSVVSWGDNNYNQTVYPESVSDGSVIFADFFQSYVITEEGDVEAWGNNGFILGSDEYGRDLFTRLVHGGRISLTVGALAILLQVIIGTLVGMVAGFYGGRIDNLLMRAGEIIGSFPFYPLVITLSAMLPAGYPPTQRMIMVMLILGFTGWPGISRLVRGQILAEREKDFVMAARALGIREKNIVLKHILPNVLNIIIVQVTLGYASSLLIEAGLSFLGFGVPYPFPSWGNMLSDAQSATVIEDYWWRWVFPGFMVFITALSINLVGDGLRDALDPKSNEK